MMNTRKLTPALILFSAMVFSANAATAQALPPEIRVTINPSQTPEQRVAEEVKLKELRREAEEKAAAEEAARIAETSPKKLLSRARILYIWSGTSFFDAVQLQNALRKRDEFNQWEMAMVDGVSWDKRTVADIIVEVDRPLFTYTFTYQITSSKNGMILATGKITAFDGNAAAPKIAARIIEEIKIARGEAKPKK
jgi:hypothetical protein